MSILLIMKMTKIKVPKMITLLAHTDWQFEKEPNLLFPHVQVYFNSLHYPQKDQFFLFLFIFFRSVLFKCCFVYSQKILYSVQILLFISLGTIKS